MLSYMVHIPTSVQVLKIGSLFLPLPLILCVCAHACACVHAICLSAYINFSPLFRNSIYFVIISHKFNCMWVFIIIEENFSMSSLVQGYHSFIFSYAKIKMININYSFIGLSFNLL